MLDCTARADAPTEPGSRPPDQFPADRDDLRRRADRLADGHPSSAEYQADGRDRRGRAPDVTSAAGPREEPDSVSHPDRDAGNRGERHDGASHGQPSDSPGRPAVPDRPDEPDRHGIGWQAPDVRDHPDRPDVSEIHLPDGRGGHILDGDGADRAGGGHRHGTGRAGKTEFPATWPDEVILPIVEEVARTPDSVELQRNGRWRATGEREGVEVTTIVLSDGRIWTAWPEPGGPGVRQNPTEGAA